MPHRKHKTKKPTTSAKGYPTVAQRRKLPAPLVAWIQRNGQPKRRRKRK
jgi:hypothetical protein